MLKRMLPLLVLVLIPAFARPETAEQPAQKPPAIIVRIASIDSLLEHLKLIGGLAGLEEIGKLDETIKAKLGPKGLFGIDGKRPLAFYGSLSADGKETRGVYMLPISTEKQFKEMLEGMGWDVRGDGKGTYAVKQDLIPGNVSYRVANGYAYLSQVGFDAVPKPETLFAAKQSAAISITLRFDQLPDGVRSAFLEGFKEGAGGIDNAAGTSNAQKALMTAAVKELNGFFESVFTDGEELNAAIDIDAKTKQLSADLTLSAKAKTKLAEKIAKLGQRRTLFAGVLAKDAAMNGLINIEMPPALREAMAGLMQETIAKVLADQKEDTGKKQSAELFEALKPSLTADDVDAGFSFRGPGKDKTFTLVAGFKLKQGDKLVATLLKMMNDLPESERGTIKLNADKTGDVAIHRLELQKSLDAKTKEMFGDHPLFLAFRDDAVFAAIGEEGLAALKQAVTTKAAEAAGVHLDLSMTRLALMMQENQAGAKTAQEMLQAGDEARMRLVLNGGATLRVQLTLGLSALKLFGQEK